MNKLLLTVAISVLAGCSDNDGSKFVGEWSCEREMVEKMDTVSIRHNDGSNYIIDISGENKAVATYKDGKLESPTKYGTLSIDKQSGKLIGMNHLCRNGEMNRIK